MTAARGFTLLELLVAVAIFALTGAMAYTGLQQVLEQQNSTEREARRLSDLQKAYRIMQRDLEQLVRRGIRNEFGDSVGAMVGGSGFTGVTFSRIGHANPAGFVRSEIQRVAYVPDQTELLRRTWRVLDRAQDSAADEQVLVEGLQRFALRFLDRNDEWQESWPPQQQTQTAGSATGGFDALPKAIEVALELDDTGILNWLFVMPDSVVVSARQAGPPGGAQGGTGQGNTGGQP